MSSPRPVIQRILLFAILGMVSCLHLSCDSSNNLEAASNQPCKLSETQVTCSVVETDYKPSCTVFFGAGTPVLVDFNETEKTVTFPTPRVVSGEKRDVVFQCGAGDPQTIQKNFEIVEKKAEPADSGNPPPLPSSPSPLPPSPPPSDTTISVTPPPPSDSSGDAVVPAPVDPCPGPGCTVDLGATVTAEPVVNSRLGLVKVEWNVTGGRTDLTKLYIYSAGFNRLSNENVPLPPGGRNDPSFDRNLYCQAIDDVQRSSNGKRRLLVHSDGSDLNPNTPNYDQVKSYLDSAEFCADDAHCKGYIPAGTSPEPTVCRMSLVDGNGNFVRQGKFFTRPLQPGPFTLMAKTADGNEVSVGSSPVTIAPSELTVTLGRVISTSDKIEFEVDVVSRNAIGDLQKPSDCRGQPVPQGDEVDYHLTCLLKSGRYEFSVQGLGSRLVRSYTAGLDNPLLSLRKADYQCHGVLGTSDLQCEGKVDLEVTVGRRYWIQRDGAAPSMFGRLGTTYEKAGTTTAGIVSSSIKLYDQGLYSAFNHPYPTFDRPVNRVPGPMSVLLSGAAVLHFADVPRNHQSYAWQVKIDGTPYESSPVDLSYTAEFHPVVGTSEGTCNWSSQRGGIGVSWFRGNNCSGVNIYGACIGGQSHRRYASTDFSVDLKSRHIQKIKVTCDGDVEFVTVSPESYQEATTHITRNRIDPDFTCTFEGIDFQGRSVGPFGNFWSCP